jgi:hypothetical protein
METESKKLLKKGIISLLPENNDIFKQNIIDALVFKIHENVDNQEIDWKRVVISRNTYPTIS